MNYYNHINHSSISYYKYYIYILILILSIGFVSAANETKIYEEFNDATNWVSYPTDKIGDGYLYINNPNNYNLNPGYYNLNLSDLGR